MLKSWCSTLLLVAALLLPVTTARAQGTSGTFVGPINSQQLEGYADRMRLSAPQRLAIQAEHDAYRQEFRALREGAIVEFLRRQQGAQGGIPRRELVDQLLDELGDIEGRIAEVDNRLFDRLLPILTEEQRRVLPRVRLDRERARYDVRLAQANLGRPLVDLSDLMLGIELEHDTALATDAMLAPYERRLTSIMRKQNEAMNRMTLDMMDLLAERGFEDISQEQLLGDPELLQKVVKEISAVYTDLQAGVSELGAEIRVLNGRTYRQLAGVMPAPAARALRDAFYENSYAELATVVALSKHDWMTRAMQLEDLDDTAREVLASSAQRYDQALDRALDASFQRVEEYWNGFSPFTIDAEAAETMQRDLVGQLEAAERARNDAETALTAALGADVVARMREAAARLVVQQPVRTVRGPFASAFDRDRPVGVADDPFLPAPIGAADLDHLARRLGFDADARTVLNMLHADYEAALAAAPVYEQLREARLEQSRAIVDPERDAEEAIARTLEIRRAALRDVLRADAEFFAGLRSLRDESDRPLIERAARMRFRAAYAGSGSAGIVLGRDVSQESRVELLATLLDAGLGSADLDAIAEVLDDYERAAAEALQARFEARLALQRVTDAWTAELTRAGREDLSAVVLMQTRFREAMREPSQRLQHADEAIASLNRTTLERVLPALPTEARGAVRREYERTAYPSIFDDPAGVGDLVAAALGLPDLSTRQRDDLMQLAADYRPEYERLTQLMIGAVGTAGLNVVGLEAEAFAEWQRHQQEVTKLRFDRNELNARAISRLGALLSEPQIAALGGLPEPLGEDDFFLFR